MAAVYILYSPSLDKFYTGSCLDLALRLEQHSTKLFSDAFTSRAVDWELFLVLDDLEYRQARKIEQHIKNMKSATFIKNLKAFQDLRADIIQRFK